MNDTRFQLEGGDNNNNNTAFGSSMYLSPISGNTNSNNNNMVDRDSSFESRLGKMNQRIFNLESTLRVVLANNQQLQETVRILQHEVKLLKRTSGSITEEYDPIVSQPRKQPQLMQSISTEKTPTAPDFGRNSNAGSKMQNLPPQVTHDEIPTFPPKKIKFKPKTPCNICLKNSTRTMMVMSSILLQVSTNRRNPGSPGSQRQRFFLDTSRGLDKCVITMVVLPDNDNVDHQSRRRRRKKRQLLAVTLSNGTLVMEELVTGTFMYGSVNQTFQIFPGVDEKCFMISPKTKLTHALDGSKQNVTLKFKNERNKFQLWEVFYI